MLELKKQKLNNHSLSWQKNSLSWQKLDRKIDTTFMSVRLMKLEPAVGILSERHKAGENS